MVWWFEYTWRRLIEDLTRRLEMKGSLLVIGRGREKIFIGKIIRKKMFRF